MTGERAKLSSPQQDKAIATNRKADRQKPPYYFLVTGLSEEACNILNSHPIISTADSTAFIVPYTPPTPRFFLSIEGFTLSIRDAPAIQEAEHEVRRVVRTTFRENEEIASLLKSKLINDGTSQHNLEPALNILGSVEVKLAAEESTAPRTQKFGAKKPIWNIFRRRTTHHMARILYASPSNAYTGLHRP